MTDKKHLQRKILRLQDYDYSQSGGYFVTLCVHQKMCYFGSIIDGKLQLNDVGRMIDYWWREIQNKYQTVVLDEYIIMPNHIHAIIFLDDNPKMVAKSLSNIIQWFKTMTTNAYIHGVKESGWQRYEQRLWQRSFYDHIIRSEEALNRIRQYILLNPENWLNDDLYI